MGTPVADAQIKSTNDSDVRKPNGFLTDSMTLDGTNSVPNDSSISSYSWSIVDQPTGASASLSDATASQPDLQNIDKAGTYRMFLVVTNDNGEQSKSDVLKAPDSAFCRVHVEEPNEPIVVPATGQRNYQPYTNEWAGAIDGLRKDMNNHSDQHVAASVTGKGSDPIDGDQLEITWTGQSNYTRDTGPNEVSAKDQLTAHLKGLDQRIAPSSKTHRGTIEIANQDETDNGTDATRAVSPETLFGSPITPTDAAEGTVQTSGNTPTTPSGAKLTLDDNTSYYVRAEFVARDTTTTDRAVFVREAAVGREGGGGASITGFVNSTADLGGIDDADADIVTNGDDVEAQVTGVSSTNIEWYARLTVSKISTA